jgi:hypothetical protein
MLCFVYCFCLLFFAVYAHPQHDGATSRPLRRTLQSSAQSSSPRSSPSSSSTASSLASMNGNAPENVDIDNLDDVCDDEDGDDEDEDDDDDEDDYHDADDNDDNGKSKALDLALIPPHLLARFFATSWRSPAFQIFPRKSSHSSSSSLRGTHNIGSGYDHFMSRVARCWWGSLLVHPISSVELTTAWPYFAHGTFHEDAFHSDLRY